MSVGLNAERVVSVYSEATSRRGSGYLLQPNLVLTAAHCVGEVERAVEARRLRSLGGGAYNLDSRQGFEVVLRGDGSASNNNASMDFALLRAWQDDPFEMLGTAAASEAPKPRLPLRLGRVVGTRAIPAEALGFPVTQKGASGAINVEHAQGELSPLTGGRTEHASGRADRLLHFQVRSGTPTIRPCAPSLWSGASGSALFSGEHLVGVIVEDPEKVQGRLVAAPVSVIFGASGLHDANRHLAECAGLDRGGEAWPVEAVWSGRSVLELPYEPLPREWSSADLLLPRYNVVSFGGRDQELGQLEQWYTQDAQPHRISMMLLTGDGAVGKSRLARELCRRASGSGWTAGLLSPVAVDVTDILGLDENRLVVVDDAEVRAGQLDALLAGSTGESSRFALRVLAVARREGEWWEALGRRYDAIVRKDPLTIEAPNLEERRRTYERAVAAFTALLPTGHLGAESGQATPGAVAPTVFEDEDFASYLLILVQALVDASGSGGSRWTGFPSAASPPAEATREGELFERVLDLERRAWRDAATAGGLPADDVLLERIVAVSSLAFANGDSAGRGETDAAARLRLVPDLSDATEQVRRAYARWERQRYEGYGYLRALRPQRLAEHVAAKIVASFPELAAQLLDVSHSNPVAPSKDVDRSHQVVNTLRLLSNAAFPDERMPNRMRSAQDRAAVEAGADGQPSRAIAQQHPALRLNQEVAEALRDALRAHTPALLQMAKNMVSHPMRSPEDVTGKSLVAALEAAILRFPEGDVASEAVEVLEEDCPDVLLGLAVKVMGRAADHNRRQMATSRSISNRRTLATSLKLLSRFLADSGEKQKAHESAWESVEQFRGLVRRESTDDNRLGLAHALTNLAVRLDDIGRYQESVETAREAVALYDQLRDARPDRWHHVYLANGYSNLSLAASDAGRWREALQWAGQAHDLVDQDLPMSSDDDPGDSLLAAQALAQRMLARQLSEADRGDEAVTAAKNACQLYERLAHGSPSTWRRDHARSLSALGSRLAEVGRWVESVDAHRKAVDRYKELEQEYREAVRGDHADAQRDLAASYFGIHCESGGQRSSDTTPDYLGESHKAIDASLEHYRAMRSADLRARQRGHALALRWKARISTACGAPPEASEAAEDAIKLYEKLGSNTLRDQRDLAFAHLVHAHAVLTSGRRDEQEAAVAECLDARERLKSLNEEEPHFDPLDIKALQAELDALLAGRNRETSARTP